MRAVSPLLKTLAARSLLALAFVFAQHTAALHWLSHAIEATHAKAGGNATLAEHCDECLGLGALGSAALGGDTVPSFGAVSHAVAAVPAVVPAHRARRLAFRSRAPPVLS